jgi:hypothetical protein
MEDNVNASLEAGGDFSQIGWSSRDPSIIKITGGFRLKLGWLGVNFANVERVYLYVRKDAIGISTQSSRSDVMSFRITRSRYTDHIDISDRHLISDRSLKGIEYDSSEHRSMKVSEEGEIIWLEVPTGWSLPH